MRAQRIRRCAKLAEFSENLIIVLAELGRRRIDTWAAMSESECGERHGQFTLDARTCRVAVNDAAAPKLRIGQSFPHRAHACGRYMARLQKFLPFGGAL